MQHVFDFVYFIFHAFYSLFNVDIKNYHIENISKQAPIHADPKHLNFIPTIGFDARSSLLAQGTILSFQNGIFQSVEFWVDNLRKKSADLRKTKSFHNLNSINEGMEEENRSMN